MSLEANKFLGRLYGEAVADQQRQDEQIRRKIKGQKEVQEVVADVDLSQRDYQFFRRILNNISFELYQVQTSIAEDDDDALTEYLANVISDWNNLVSALSRIKYKNLKYADRTKVYNDIKEIRPTLSQISGQLMRKAGINDKFEALQVRIDNIISQIDKDVYDQVSYPLKEQVGLLNVDDDEGEEDDDEEGEEDDDEEN
jgi:hypothetical protein